MTVTVADVVRDTTDALRVFRGGWLPHPVERALRDIGQCRTSALGGHLYVCDECGGEVPVYNSCLNRHCPQCQSRARSKWLEARMEDLLPVPYFHLVFTVPSELRPCFRADPRALYSILFRAAWESLRELAADPKRLGAQPGALAVLHTWSQTLSLHPHVHMVVPGGGFDPRGQWVASRPAFLVDVKTLSKLFAGRFLHLLDRGVRRHGLRLPEDMEASPSLWLTTRESLRSKRWVVYAKPPFGGPAAVLRYLARYTHRVAIGNSRLLAYEDGQVTFRYKTRSSDPGWKTMCLPAFAGCAKSPAALRARLFRRIFVGKPRRFPNRLRFSRLDSTENSLLSPAADFHHSLLEFLRRFTLHILPPRFVRIRYYGFLSNRNRRESVARCREQLGTVSIEDAQEAHEEQAPSWEPRCPHCGEGDLQELRSLPRDPSSSSRASQSRASPSRAPP